MADVGTVETVDEVLELLTRVEATAEVWEQMWNRLPMAVMVEVEAMFNSTAERMRGF